MATTLKPFAFLGRGFLHVNVAGKIRVKVPNMVVEDVAELEALGSQHIEELVHLGAASYELTLPGGRPRRVDPDLLLDARAAEEREQVATDFDRDQESATQRNERQRVQGLVAPAKKEK